MTSSEERDKPALGTRLLPRADLGPGAYRPGVYRLLGVPTAQGAPLRTLGQLPPLGVHYRPPASEPGRGASGLGPPLVPERQVPRVQQPPRQVTEAPPTSVADDRGRGGASEGLGGSSPHRSEALASVAQAPNVHPLDVDQQQRSRASTSGEETETASRSAASPRIPPRIFPEEQTLAEKPASPPDPVEALADGSHAGSGERRAEGALSRAIDIPGLSAPGREQVGSARAASADAAAMETVRPGRVSARVTEVRPRGLASGAYPLRGPTRSGEASPQTGAPPEQTVQSPPPPRTEPERSRAPGPQHSATMATRRDPGSDAFARVREATLARERRQRASNVDSATTAMTSRGDAPSPAPAPAGPPKPPRAMAPPAPGAPRLPAPVRATRSPSTIGASARRGHLGVRR